MIFDDGDESEDDDEMAEDEDDEDDQGTERGQDKKKRKRLSAKIGSTSAPPAKASRSMPTATSTLQKGLTRCHKQAEPSPNTR